MDPITFDEIPLDWLEPDTLLEVRPNYRNVGLLPYPVKNVVIGQMLGTGTLEPLTLVQVTRPGMGATLFGAGSVGAEMLEAFFETNKTQPVYVIGVDDADESVVATGTFTFTGSFSGSVVLRALVNGRQVRFTLTGGMTVTQMATALKDAINAATGLPVTAASALGVVTVTCRHGGEVGNEIDLRMDLKAQPLPTGLAVAVAAMSGGTGNPDLDDALDVLENSWMTAAVQPWNDATNMAKFAAWLRARYVATAKLDVLGYVGKRGTFGQLDTWGKLTNCPFLVQLGLNRSPTAAWGIAARAMGLASFHLANDPARQLRSLVLTGAISPDEDDQFTKTENNFLLDAGVSTFGHLPDGALTVSRMATAYRVSNLNVPDRRTWLDVMTPATMSRIRYDWAMYISLLYPRSKLVADEATAALASPVGATGEDGEDPGNAVVTPRRMRASWAARCALYASRVWIQQYRRTVNQSRFEIDDADDDRMNAQMIVRIAGNMMVFAGALEFEAR